MTDRFLHDEGIDSVDFKSEGLKKVSLRGVFSMFGFEKIFDINGNGELNILERGLEFMVIDEILLLQEYG